MRPKLMVLLFMSTSLFCSAQELKNKFGEVYYTPDLYKQTYQSPEGSPYLNPQFKPAKVNDLKETKLVRFDAVNDQIEIKVKANSVMILDDKEPYKIVLNDGSGKEYHTLTYLDDKGEVRRSYFQLLHNGDQYKIYLKERIEFQKAQKAGAYKEALPARFEKQDNTFFITGLGNPKNDLIEVSNRVNKFVEIFGTFEKQMKDYIKENDLRIERIDDLVKSMDYYYSNNWR